MLIYLSVELSVLLYQLLFELLLMLFSQSDEVILLVSDHFLFISQELRIDFTVNGIILCF